MNRLPAPDRHQELRGASVLREEVNLSGGNVGACLQTHGGFGFACEYDVERKFRDTRPYPVAPISTHLVFSCVAKPVPGLPRSF